MNRVSDWLQNLWGKVDFNIHEDLVQTFFIILLLWLVRTLIFQVIYRRVEDVRIRYRWRKTITYVAFAIGVVLVGNIWVKGFQSLATYLGLLSAGLAIALQDLIVNLAAWAFILWRRPFEVGDRVQLGEYSGDVIDQRIFMFTLMEIGNWVDADQSTGRVIHLPNGKIFREVLANYSKGFQYIWHEVPVLITFESDWKKAKEILMKIVNKHAEHLSNAAQQQLRNAAKRLMIFYTKLTPTVYTTVRDSGVLLTLRFLCEPQRRRGTEEGIWEDILDEFAQCPDIDFAYPTYRYYDNVVEGKPQARAEPPSKNRSV